VPEPLLTVLKLACLALLYLFFFRVVRAVWAEISPRASAVAPAPTTYVPMPAPEPLASRAERHGNRRSPRRLVILEPKENKGLSYDLSDELTVGRAPGCQVTIDDSYVSQLHARIFRRDGTLYVEDLGSTNGTFLNRKKVSAPAALRKGDRIQIGKTVMELQ
jgi:pSer/pThr/pTyr-binding forkhead associated (FHA) protein